MKPGDKVLHYEIEARLGEGGMGVVYRARDTRLARPVALKFLSSSYVAKPHALDRLLLEARTASAIDHPNLCTLHAIEEDDDGRLFLVMAYYEGETLAQRMARIGGPLMVDEALRIARAVARGLAASHAAGILHRDIKPSNIMLLRGGDAKILDFGLARFAEDSQRLTKSGSAVGTVAYMSPEQLTGEAVDARADLWSLGVVLYEMLTGDTPFDDASPGSLVYSIVHREPRDVAALRVDLDADAAAIVDSLLRKDPAERPPNASRVASELGRLLARSANAPTTAVDATRSTPGYESVRSRTIARPRRRARIVAALAATGLVGVGVGWWALRRPAAETATGEAIGSSVAVLPFANLTGRAELDYLGEGLSALLMQELSTQPGLSVAARSETTPFGGDGRAARDVARALGVAAVIEGQLLPMDDALRLQLSLTDERGRVAWSDSAVGSVPSLFRFVETAEARLVGKLTGAAESTTRAVAESGETTRDPRAQELYLRALSVARDVENPQRWDLSATAFRQVLERDPAFAAARAGLAESLARLYARDRTPELLTEAEEEAGRAHREAPRLVASTRALATVLRNAGRPGEAVRQLEAALAWNPKSDALFQELSSTQMARGDLRAAEISIRQAIALRPNFWEHWNELGSILLKAAEYAGARDAFAKAAALAPSGVTWPRQNLAALAMTQGDFQTAVAEFARIPEPITDPELASNAGTAYFFLGDYAAAAERYRLAIRLAPNSAAFHANLGDALGEQGDRDGARREYRTAADLAAPAADDGSAPAGSALDAALYSAKAGECARATAAAQRATGSEVASEQVSIAKVFALCARRSEAIAAARRARELGVPADALVREPELAPLAGELAPP